MTIEDPQEGDQDQPSRDSGAKIGSLSLYLIGAGVLLLIALLAFAY